MGRLGLILLSLWCLTRIQCAGCADDVPETTTVNIATTEEPDLTTVIPVEDPTTIIPVEDPTTVIPVADSTTILPAGDSTTLVQINLTTTTESTRRLEITEINGRNELKSSLPRRNATARLEDCQDVKLLQEKLYFGVRMKETEMRMLPQISNLTWSRDILRPIQCATEFVVVYEVIGNTTETSSILCASFDVIENHANFTCLTNFTQDLCNQTVKFKLETWVITGELFQPESEPVRINCNADFIQVFQKQSTDQVYQAMSHQIQSQLSSAEDDNDDILIGNIATGEGDNLEEMVELAPLVLNPKSVSCAWSSWSPWSKCPPRCGDTPGIRTRSRSQRGSRLCGQNEKETKPCYVNKCPQDCVFVTWSEWSTCSQTCGTGTKSRTRSIGREAEFGGKPCVGKTSERTTCSINNCAVDGVWSEWTAFGYCDQPCGNGTRFRTRSCTNPFPENGGQRCVGVSSEQESCIIKKCDPVDGQWSLWSRWSSCSTSCDRGEITRTRDCSRPEPQYGGLNCTGESQQHRGCFLGPCGTRDIPGPPLIEKRPTYINSRPYINRFLSKSNGNNKKFSLNLRTNILNRKGNNDESSKSEEDLADEADICLETAPRILGFLGPFLDGDTEEDELDNHNPPLNQTLFYRCRQGQVTDVRTNQRTFQTHCAANGFVGLSSAQCSLPSHCVGPPELMDPNILPIPRRDAKVSSKVLLIDPSHVGDTLYFGFCFPDGRYRFPNQSELFVPSQCQRTQFTHVGQFGWIAMVGHESETCRIEGPIGYGFQIGLIMRDTDEITITDHLGESDIQVRQRTSLIVPSHDLSIHTNSHPSWILIQVVEP